MQIAKCLIIVLVTVGVLFGGEQPVSNTRTASCIVRITADPEIIQLNSPTVSQLVQSYAVLGIAARDVLELDIRANPGLHQCVEFEWLAQAAGPVGQIPAPGSQLGQIAAPTRNSRDQGRPGAMGQPPEDNIGRDLLGTPPGDSAPTDASGQGNTPGAMMGGGMMGGMSGDMGGLGGGMMGAGGMSGSGGGMTGGYGMGGMGGGMMGAGGMGGFGAGMMGGYGMGGYGGGVMGGVYGRARPEIPATPHQQSITFRLSVNAPEYAPPMAQEFLKAIVGNLRQRLEHTFEMQEGQIAELLSYKERQCEGAQVELEEAMGARPARTRKGEQLESQLETVVDLSMFTPEMPFSEAIHLLKYAVEPPLPIVVMWKELMDSCDVQPNTAIDMDGLPSVKLATALRTLLEAVSGGVTDISYQVDDDVIVIREEEMPNQQPMGSGPSVEVDVMDLMAQRRDLARRRQALEMDFATSEARRRAIEEQFNVVRMKTAKEIEEDSVAREMQTLVEMSQKHLDMLAKQAEAGNLAAADLTKARESLTRAKIELARRREDLASSAGGGQLKEFNSELSRMTIDMAEKRAELDFIRQQLAQTEDQLAQASRFDPRATRIRMARRALDAAEAQVTQLRARLASLRFPTLAVIGAD